jgi:hypothetical protein
MKHDHRYATLKAGVALAILLSRPSFALAQTGLGSATSYTVLAGSAITNSGLTKVRGSMGVSPGLVINGLPFGQPTLGSIHAGDAGAAQAQVDLATAYNAISAMSCTSPIIGVVLGGGTLRPGTFCFYASAHLAGILKLDACGDSAAVFVFKIPRTLTLGECASIVLCNGAQPSHVWWVVGEAATLGPASAMQGNLLVRSHITLASGASLVGRAQSMNGAVTMHGNTIVGTAGIATATMGVTWTRLKAQYR